MGRDLLDRVFLPVFKDFGFNLEQDMFLLGLVMQHGLKFCFGESYIDGVSEQDFRDELKKLVARVPFRFLLEDQKFLNFLQMRMVNLLNEKGNDFRRIILDDLIVIFGQEKAELLFKTALQNYCQNLEKGEEHVKKMAEAFVAYRKERFAELESWSQPSSDRSFVVSKPLRHEKGTDTSLIPCPQCQIKKRCDGNTKRFRCKCGFDSPYPFSK